MPPTGLIIKRTPRKESSNKLPPYPHKELRTTAEPLDGSEIDLSRYLSILKKRKWVVIAPLLLTLSLSILLNLIHREIPRYQSSVTIIFEPRDSVASDGGWYALSYLKDPTFVFTQTNLIKSIRFAERVLTKLESSENRDAIRRCFLGKISKKNTQASFSEKEQKALLGVLRSSISISEVAKEIQGMNLQVMGYDPVTLAHTTNMAADTYTELYYESQMASYRKNFVAISRNLAEVREVIKAGELASQQIETQIQLLTALKIYGDKHPSVIQLRSQVPDLAQKLQKVIKNLKILEISQRADLLPLLVNPHTDLKGLQSVEEDLRSLKPILEQEINTNRGMYDAFFKKLQELQLSGNGQSWINLKILNEASIPQQPISAGNGLGFLIALLVGMAMGLGLAFGLEYLDSSIRYLDELQNYLKILPLGMIPEVRFNPPLEDQKPTAGLEATKLPRSRCKIGNQDIPLHFVEAYSIIRTHLAFGQLDKSLKVLQITSAIKGEGKTTTAVNLGITFAQAGLKTLLIDADMRCPALHQFFGCQEVQAGLSDILNTEQGWQSIVQETPLQGLSVIYSGSVPSNPSELLSSKGMRMLLKEVRTHFDLVILDSPPVISMADSSIIASHVDSTLLVIRAGFIPRHLHRRAKNSLETISSAKVIGGVLNSVMSQDEPYYYYYHDGGKSQSERIKVMMSTTFERCLRVLKAIKDEQMVHLSATTNSMMSFIKSQWFRK